MFKMLSCAEIQHKSRSTCGTRRTEDAVRFQERSHTSLKALISFVMPVLSFALMCQHGSHWKDVREIFVLATCA
jgi:hypothetical protein